MDALECFEGCVRYCSFELYGFEELPHSISCHTKELGIYSQWLVAAKRATVSMPFFAVSFHSKWKILSPHVCILHLLLLDKGDEDRRSDWVTIRFGEQRKPMS